MIHMSTPPLSNNARIYFGLMPDAAEINRQIMEAYMQLREQDLLKRSLYLYRKDGSPPEFMIEID